MLSAGPGANGMSWFLDIYLGVIKCTLDLKTLIKKKKKSAEWDTFWWRGSGHQLWKGADQIKSVSPLAAAYLSSCSASEGKDNVKGLIKCKKKKGRRAGWKLGPGAAKRHWAKDKNWWNGRGGKVGLQRRKNEGKRKGICKEKPKFLVGRYGPVRGGVYTYLICSSLLSFSLLNRVWLFISLLDWMKFNHGFNFKFVFNKIQKGVVKKSYSPDGWLRFTDKIINDTSIGR